VKEKKKKARPKVAPGSLVTTNTLMKTNWLLAEEGELAGKTFHIGMRNITIGRGTNNFIQINDSEASRVHCAIRATEEGMEVVDMRSANGTYVNGKRIKHHLLQDEDHLRIGDVAFSYLKMAGYEVDHGLGRKDAGTDQMRETTYAVDLDLGAMAWDALKAADGDMEKAAESINLDLNTFLEMLKK